MHADLNLQQLSTSYQHFHALFPEIKLPSELKDFGQISLQMRAKGFLSDIKATDVLLATQSNTSFKGNAQLTGLPDLEKLKFNLDIDQLTTRATDWSSFLNNNIPPILDSLGIIKYSGKLSGNLKDFVLNGTTNTAIGNLKSDLQLTFNQTYTDATYYGKLLLEAFDLGKVLSDTIGFGKTTVYLIGSGAGLQIDSLKAHVEAVVEQLELNGYEYNNLNVEGDFDQKQFNGIANFSDENASFDFMGIVNLNDSLPEFKFEMIVDTIDFQALRLTQYPLGLKTNTKMNFHGNSLSNLNGEIFISNLLIRDSSQTFNEDSLYFRSMRSDVDTKIMTFSSQFLNAEMKGDFNVELLPLVIRHFINDFFPVIIDSTLSPIVISKLEKQNFTFDVKLDDPELLKFTGIPQLTEIESARLQGEFNYPNRNFDITTTFVKPSFYNFNADTLILLANASAQKITTKLTAVNLQKNQIMVPDFTLSSLLANDSLHFDISASDTTGIQQLATNGVIAYNSKHYTLNIRPDIVINDETWSASNENVIYFNKNYLFVDRFSVQKDNHLFKAQSQGNYPNDVVSPVELKFSDYYISDLIKMAGLKEYAFEGIINGYLKLVDIFDNLHYETNIKIKDLSLEKELIGQMDLNANQKFDGRDIIVNLNLSGEVNNFKIEGAYNPDQQQFDITCNIQALEMKLLNPFTKGIIRESEGIASGIIKLNGTPEKPKLQSELVLQNTSTNIVFLNSRITIPKHVLQITDRQIALGDVSIIGQDNKKATLNGIIKHRFFRDFDMDLLFQTTDFNIMNTTEKDNSLFWGNLNLSTDIRIKGSFIEPLLDIQAQTLANSTFFIQTPTIDESVAGVDYITFANPNDFDEYTTDSLRQAIQLKNSSKLDLRINLQVTPDAELQFIIDPISGDRVISRGYSSMTIRLAPNGSFDIFGDYILESGKYRFSYGQFVKKEFSIEPGSKVSFSGYPLDSRLDITASYLTNTAPLELIRNEVTLSETEQQQLQQRTLVKTLLILKGDLLHPLITFDIEFPKNEGTVLNSAITRKLLDLRQDTDAMNKQVFSLLIFNNFFPSSNSGDLLVNTGENLALSSVSKLISNQLNNLADKLIKGVEVSIDLDSYQAINDQNTVTELQVGISKKLFNDRLTVKAGADLGINSTSNSSRSDFTNLAGDFILEYKLTPNGNYILKVFRRSDFDILRDENTSRNGIGISAKKSFGN